MTATTPNPYLRTTVMTASPSELRLLLLDGAIKFLEQGRAGLVDGIPERAFEGLTRCQAIILELINALRHELATDLCKNLSALYTFMYTQLIKASTERDVTIADEVLELIRFERATWVMAMDQLDGRDTAAETEPGSISLTG